MSRLMASSTPLGGSQLLTGLVAPGESSKGVKGMSSVAGVAAHPLGGPGPHGLSFTTWTVGVTGPTLEQGSVVGSCMGATGIPARLPGALSKGSFWLYHQG